MNNAAKQLISQIKLNANASIDFGIYSLDTGEEIQVIVKSVNAPRKHKPTMPLPVDWAWNTHGEFKHSL